jgi:hypothetical protein
VGSIKIGDTIIVTSVLYLDPNPKIIGRVCKVLFVDTVLLSYPYKIEINDKIYWVEGVLASSLMLELF